MRILTLGVPKVVSGVFLFLIVSLYLHAQPGGYYTPAETVRIINDLAKKNPDVTRVVTLATTPGKNPVILLEIGKETGRQTRTLPALLVVGNPEGDVPIATSAALYLAGSVLKDPARYEHLTWYIIPALNPDAEAFFTGTPKYRDQRNAQPHNDDMDDLTDEDGCNDLDGNGIITMMRVKDPEGQWIAIKDDPRIMRKANPSKGEKGVYKLYTEGIDDDGDGKYNEDGPGGTNVGINFPHLFKPFTASGGRWPGSAPESFALLKFAAGHPEIAMSMVYGSSDFCLVPPKKGRKGSVDMNKIKVPENMAGMIGADPDKTYSMKELIKMVQPMAPPGFEIDESVIASFLGLGAVVNPLDEDLKFYKELSEQYKKYLKDKGMEAERLDPAAAKDGSVELWAYYHLGLPSFSMDFWTLPKPKKEKKESGGLTIDQLEKMSKEDFLALDEEKIAAFLKENGAPAQFKAANVINMIKSGQVSPKQMASMMKQMPKKEKEEGEADPKTKALIAFSDSNLNGNGYLPWKPFKHPTLGEVEIGGAVPYADNTPPPGMVDSLLKIQVPWIFTLADKLPSLSLLDTKVTPKGGGVYALELWVENKGYLPYPTAMGKRDKHPGPVVVTIDGNNLTFLEGRKRTPVQTVAGLKAVKLSWLIQSEKPGTLNISLTSPSAGSDRKQIKIGG
ncbi:MAG: hypothetical protein GXO83_08505 [Chlorobi bacterium]|nr:hypothetical protein [Chlorobiota bacterium]